MLINIIAVVLALHTVTGGEPPLTVCSALEPINLLEAINLLYILAYTGECTCDAGIF